MKIKLLQICGLVALLAACDSQAPTTVAPTVDAAKYANSSCKSLSEGITASKTKVSALDAQLGGLQDKKDAGLAVGMLISPLIGAAMNGDADAQIRTIKTERAQIAAEVSAMNATGKSKGCWK